MPAPPAAPQTDTTPTGGVPTEQALQAAEARLEAIAPGYLATVREAAARIGRHDADDTLQLALDRVSDTAHIDLDVPTRSRVAAGSNVKQGVKLLVGWYLRYLAEQVAAFAAATTTLGEALAQRAEQLDHRQEVLADRQQHLDDRLDALEGRLERLEGREHP